MPGRQKTRPRDAVVRYRDVSGDTIRVGACKRCTSQATNLQQQLLLLLLTPCRGHSGVNNSPFRASQVVSGMFKCSRIKYTGHASERRVSHKYISLVSLSYGRTSYRHASHRHASHGRASYERAFLVGLSRRPVSLAGTHHTGAYLEAAVPKPAVPELSPDTSRACNSDCQ